MPTGKKTIINAVDIVVVLWHEIILKPPKKHIIEFIFFALAPEKKCSGTVLC